MTRCLVLALFLSAAPLWGAEPQNIVYDFSAEWCGPCRQMAPLVEKLEKEGLPIRKVDVDKEKALAAKYRVSSLPTFVVVIDGAEAQRISGGMTETDLRRLVAKVSATADPAIARNGGVPNVELGSPMPMSEAGERVASNTPAASAASANSPMGSALNRLLPGRSTASSSSSGSEQLTVRANNSELSSVAEDTPNSAPLPESTDPMEASVRIRVIIDGKINLGSGTIIQSYSGMTKILTCAHIFRGFNDDSKIEVDLRINNKEQTHIARLDNYNEEADLGLISVATTRPLPAAAIAKVQRAPQLGEPVIGIGCSGGDPPTREQIRVTAVDKYNGPHNIECTGMPVRGRSGGGLFNAQGQIVGVCIAADRDEKRGLYSGLLAVHDLLEQSHLAHLFREPAPAAASVAAVDSPMTGVPQPVPGDGDNPFSRFSSGNTPAAGREASSSNTLATTATPAPRAVDVATGSAEVVVIIRDPSQPQAPNRVIIIHDASQKFLSYLDGELDQNGPALRGMSGRTEAIDGIARQVRSETTHHEAALVESSPRNLRSTPKLHISEDSQLEPTSLSQPMVPRRYVRGGQASTLSQ